MEPRIFRHLSSVRKRLRAEFGPGVTIPCGKTAEAVEADFVFEALPSLTDVRPCSSSLYRLHFEIDAENISDDHVVFAAVDVSGATIFHSYTNIHSVLVRRVNLKWLTDAQDMVLHRNDPVKAWNRLFELEKSPPLVVSPVTVTCHVSRSHLL